MSKLRHREINLSKIMHLIEELKFEPGSLTLESKLLTVMQIIFWYWIKTHAFVYIPPQTHIMLKKWMGWGGRWEGQLGWGTHVNPWLTHVNVWQKPLQYCKVISLQLIKINEKKKKEKRKRQVFHSQILNRWSFLIGMTATCAWF